MNAQTFKENHAKIDWILILALLGLMVVGIAFIYSATMINEASSLAPWYRQHYILQGAWYIIGIMGAVSICLLDYHILARWSLVAYWATILLLIFVLIVAVFMCAGSIG